MKKRLLNRVVFFFVLRIKRIRKKGMKLDIYKEMKRRIKREMRIKILLKIKNRMRVWILLEIKREIKNIMG